MGDTYLGPYNPTRPMTLQDLLAHANAQSEDAVATPQPPDPARVDIPGATSPQDRQKLLDMLMAPDDVGPAPQVDKANAMSLLFTGLGDAMNAMVAGQTGNPGMRSDAMGQYLRTIESQKQDLRDYQQRKGMAHNVSKNRTAQYLLSEMDRKQSAADALQGRKDLQAAGLAQAKALADENQKNREASLQIERDRIAAQERMNTLDNTTRANADAKQMALAKLKATGEADKDQHDEYKKVRMWAVANKADIIAKVKSGELTPDQVRETIQGMLDASDLVGPYRDAASAFIENQIGVGLARHEFAQTYEPQGPYKQTNYPVPAGAATLQRRPVGGGL